MSGIIVIVLVLGLVVIFLFVTKKPHGFVEFKTGLVLMYLPKMEGEIDMIKLRQDYIDLGANRISKLKIKTDEIRDIKIPTRHGEILGRAYIKNEAREKPLVVFFHGGGWCLGNVNTHKEQCIRVANASGLSVLSVDYSLAPENPFPHAVEECIDAVDWILERSKINFAHHSEVILMGDSAGGNLSIVVTLERLQRKEKIGIMEVVPIYPVTDCYSEKKGSYDDFSKGYYLTKDLMDAFEKCYFTRIEDKKSLLASPIFANDLSGFPDTYMITAGFDPLRDEGEAFAKKLKENGVNVICKRVESAVHGFFALEVFGNKGVRAVNEMGAYLRNKY